jgi:hypothetical protein
MNEAFNRRAMEMALTRQRLSSDPMQRRVAVCMFPLIVAQVADDMRRILGQVDGQTLTADVESGLQFMEDIIRDEYRNQFGTELGQ